MARTRKLAKRCADIHVRNAAGHDRDGFAARLPAQTARVGGASYRRSEVPALQTANACPETSDRKAAVLESWVCQCPWVSQLGARGYGAAK